MKEMQELLNTFPDFKNQKTKLEDYGWSYVHLLTIIPL